MAHRIFIGRGFFVVLVLCDLDFWYVELVVTDSTFECQWIYSLFHQICSQDQFEEEFIGQVS
jgi:hypothetical protein